MKLLGSTVTEGVRVQGSQRGISNLSKIITPGGKYRLFFPIVKNELTGLYDVLAATAPVRKLDYKKLNIATLPLEDFDVTDTGRIVDKSGLNPLARISRIMLEAECANEKDKAKRDAKEEADLQSNGVIDQVALAKRLDAIEEKYHGNPEKEGVYPEVNQAIGKVDILIATECLCVPLDPARNGAPDWDKAQTAAIELRSTKIGQLKTCLGTASNVDFESGFLEVNYDYSGSTDKKVLGRTATFQTVAKDQWLKNLDAEGYKLRGLDALARVSHDAEGIAAKNLSLSANTKASDVRDAYLKYLSKQAIVISKINFEDEMVKKAAKDLLDYQIGASITGFADKCKAAAIASGAIEDGETEDRNEVSAEHASEAIGVQTISELDKIADSIDDITGDDMADL